MAYIALIAGALCGVLRCLLKKYIFSACTTLLCACAVAAGENGRMRSACSRRKTMVGAGTKL